LDTFSGSIKAYATTSDTRLALVPDIPTFGEIGLGKLNAAALEVLADPLSTTKF
jgi:tripartite-type tricarboxylate transporter receptor subunit TctC